MALILVIAAVVLVGTIIDQAPQAVIADSAAYTRWLDGARANYGGWTDLLDQLQLFNVFHSLLFRALMSLLAVSIVVCTTKRWNGIWTITFHTRTRVNEGFLRRARFHSEFDAAMPASEAAERLRQSLSRARYRVRAEAGADSVAVFAEKNRFSRFGTFFTHLGLVLILGGAIVGGVWGFTDPQFTVAEGSTRSLGLGTDISVRLDRSINDYYADGRPKDFRSDITLLEDGREVKQGTVLVNSPLRYKGIAFHESFFGQAVNLKIQDTTGSVLFEGGVPLALKSSDGLRPVGRLDLPGTDLSVLVTGTQTGAPDNLIRPGEVRVDVYESSIRAARPQNLAPGAPVQMAGLTFTFERESMFAGLKVVKDPGTKIVWVAGGLMVLGMVMLFYLPPRRLWALCKERSDGTAEVVLGMPAQRDVSLAREFGKLNERVGKALGAHPVVSQNEGADDAV